jgi:hypothetical protein
MPPLSALFRGINTAFFRSAWHDRNAIFMDDITLSKAADIAWQTHTRAAIELHDRRAILRQGGKTLYAAILSPVDAEFSSADATAPPPNAPNPGVHKLLIHLHAAGSVRISVLFDIAHPDKPFSAQNLEHWVADSPVR